MCEDSFPEFGVLLGLENFIPRKEFPPKLYESFSYYFRLHDRTWPSHNLFPFHLSSFTRSTIYHLDLYLYPILHLFPTFYSPQMQTLERVIDEYSISVNETAVPKYHLFYKTESSSKKIPRKTNAQYFPLPVYIHTANSQNLRHLSQPNPLTSQPSQLSPFSNDLHPVSTVLSWNSQATVDL